MEKNYKISRWKGEFACKGTEKEYSLYYTQKIIGTMKKIIIILALMNFLFIIPDYFAISSKELFMKMFYLRVAFLLGFLIFYLWFNQSDNYGDYFKGITVMEFFSVSSFLHIYWIYEPVNFTIQILGLILAMAVLSTIHNRWIYVSIVNGYLIIAFFVISLTAGKESDFSTMAASAIYCIIIAGLLLFRDYQVNVYKRKRYENRMILKRFSMTDSLTGIYNRSAFENEINSSLEGWKRYGRIFSIAIFDIDDFKIVNDSSGHLEGDRVLVGLTDLVKQEIRKMDVFARWGGEEFIVILPETDVQTALGFVERIRTKIKEKSFSKSKITCSFGVTQVREGDTIDSIFSRVDEYLYLCKRAGKDMVHHDLKNEIKEA